MSSLSDIVITSAGMVTAVGADMPQSCASIRAGINRFAESEDIFLKIEDPKQDAPEPLKYAPVSFQPRISEYGLHLLGHAFRESIHHGGLSREALDQSRIILSLPNIMNQHQDQIISDFFTMIGLKPVPGTEPVFSGHCGGLIAVQKAVEILSSGAALYCIVAGADMLFNSKSLSALDAQDRIKSEKNPGGLIPGEGAAAILLETRAQAAARNRTPLATVRQMGAGIEENTILSENPGTGAGLTRALQQACFIDNAPIPFDWVVCDLNGEPYRAKEWGYAVTRLKASIGEIDNLWHPADCTGDTGAAAGVMLTAVAARAFQHGYAPSENCLIWTSSDSGERMAMVLSE